MRGAEGFPAMLIDSIPDQGNSSALGTPTTFPNDFLMTFDKAEERVQVDPYYDIHSYLYGFAYGYIPVPEAMERKNSGQFAPINYVLNQQMSNPETDETILFKQNETGKLREGNANPDSPDYNSLADFAWSADKKTLEVRIPRLLLNVRDPSRKEITADFVKSDNIYDSQFTKDVGMRFGVVQDGTLRELSAARYTWDNWERFGTTQRLKKSYGILQDYFTTVE